MILFTFISSTAANTPVINIAYPSEGDTLYPGPADSVSIFGKVFPHTAALEINGIPVTILRNGSFHAFLPVEYDSFFFACKAISDSDTTILIQSVFVEPPWKILPADSFWFDTAYTYPESEYKITAGSDIQLQCCATPCQQVHARLTPPGLVIKMTELNRPASAYWGEMALGSGKVIPDIPEQGIYRTEFYLSDSLIKYESLQISYFMQTDSGDTLFDNTAGNLSLLSPILPVMAKTKHELVLRTGHKKSYYYSLPENVDLKIAGEYRGQYKVNLHPHISAWIDTTELLITNQCIAPKAVIRNIRIEENDDHWIIKVYTHCRVPYKVEQKTDPQSLELLFFYSTADTDWIRSMIKQPNSIRVQWHQKEDDLYTLNISIDVNQQWGYNSFYDDNDNFTLLIKKPPKIYGWPFSPLKNLHILLDPGHWPDQGAIGPSRITEKEVNLRLALELKQMLNSRGAHVSLTHSGEPGISLHDRIQLSKQLNPDILLSLHHNGLPTGVNPFNNHGSSTYYYHSQSYALAHEIQEHLLDEFNLPNYGLFWDNLAMCRIPNTLSVLIEPAFLIHPGEEQLILSRSYYSNCAKAIIQSLTNFLKSAKE